MKAIAILALALAISACGSNPSPDDLPSCNEVNDTNCVVIVPDTDRGRKEGGQAQRP